MRLGRVRTSDVKTIKKIKKIFLGVAMLTLVATSFAEVGAVSAQGNADSTPEQLLVEKFAPIIMLKAQEEACDPDGEPYAPTSVEIVLDNPDILLRQVGNDDPVIMRAPTASDLYGRSLGFFLDFAGSSYKPACLYEQDFDRYSDTVTGDRQAVVYANIAQQDDRPGELVVQYWFYWYFNDWNNKHESDWEGIQLLFEASTVEEALASEPASVGYAQHEGGERASWTADKLDREGDRPVVYSSAGSHASYYSSALYLGRRGTEGFGCDNTDGPSDRLDPEVVLLPNAVDDPADPLAWLAFEGTWGEHNAGAFNGPTGPATKDRWTDPVDWHDDLRSSSVIVPSGDSQGDNIVHTFCGVVEWGSGQLIVFQTSPLRMAITIGVLLLAASWLVRRTAWDLVASEPLALRRRAGQLLRAAGVTYRKRAPSLMLFGILYLPTAVVVGLCVVALSKLPVIRQILDLASDDSGVRGAAVLLATGLANSFAFVAVNALVASAYAQFDRDGVWSARDAARRTLSRVRPLLAGYVRSFAIVALLTISIVGIPWAIRQVIRYQFLPQAVVAEDLGGRDALARSTDLVKGRWWHTAAMITIFHVIILLSGSITGLLLLLVLTELPMWLFSGLITLVYALIVPLAAVAQTLLYGDAVAASEDVPGREAAALVTN